MARIDGQGGEHREDLFAEIVGGPRLVLFVQALEIVQVDAVLDQGGEEFVVPELVLVPDHFEDIFPDGVESLARAHAVGTGIVGLVFDLLFEARHAHFKKFVQVGGHNAQEADAFQQGLTRVLRFFQHPAVEGQPAQLAVDEEPGIGKIGCRHGGGQR